MINLADLFRLNPTRLKCRNHPLALLSTSIINNTLDDFLRRLNTARGRLVCLLGLYALF